MKKLDMVIGGLELLATVGVSVLVGGAVVLIKPANLGLIKKIGVGVAGTTISCMASDGVTNYIDRKFAEVKDLFRKKDPEPEELEKEDEA